MLIILTTSLYFVVALALVFLRWLRPEFRYSWLIVAVSALVSWISVLLWQPVLPVTLDLPGWEPANIFLESISFIADGISWAFAFSIITLVLATILTATARENFPAPIPWAAILILGSLGLLAVLADNPLTLLMVWAAIDLAELIAQIRSVDGPQPSEKVVTAFAARLAGICMLLWAGMVSVAQGTPLNFLNVPSQAGIYLLIAAGLRMGVLPLHLPYASESAIRRGFGTVLRLISAASSLILFARIPTSGLSLAVTPVLLALAAVAAIYAGWMWLRAPDELSARPFWLIGMSALAMTSALGGNPVGAAAWGCALLLSGGALFLTSVQHPWINRMLWIGLWGITALPFSITAAGWGSLSGPFWWIWPFMLTAQAFLLAGYYRHTLRPTLRVTLNSLDPAAKYFYPGGIGILMVATLLLGFWGWEGALQTGAWFFAPISLLLGAALIWLAPRLRILTPVRAHWVGSNPSAWTDWLFQALWGLYRMAGRLSNALSALLEGDGGLMWTLLFLVLFISLMISQGPTP